MEKGQPESFRSSTLATFGEGGDGRSYTAPGVPDDPEDGIGVAFRERVKAATLRAGAAGELRSHRRGNGNLHFRAEV